MRGDISAGNKQQQDPEKSRDIAGRTSLRIFHLRFELNRRHGTTHTSSLDYEEKRFQSGFVYRSQPLARPVTTEHSAGRWRAGTAATDKRVRAQQSWNRRHTRGPPGSSAPSLTSLSRTWSMREPSSRNSSRMRWASKYIRGGRRCRPT